MYTHIEPAFASELGCYRFWQLGTQGVCMSNQKKLEDYGWK